MKLSRKDYITILKYYKIDVSNDAKLKYIQEKAEQILAEKLCRCIKKVHNQDSKKVKIRDTKEARAIAICQNSILTKKKLKINRFTCKKKPKFLSKKGSKTKINKIR